MRLKRIMLTAAGGVLVASGFAVPAQAGLTTFCDGTASDVTVPGDLVVGAGDSCELTNVTVNGSVTVRAGANLLLEDSVVEGALRANDDAYVSLVDSEARDVTRLNTAFGLYSEDSSHALNVVADEAEFVYALDSTFERNVTATDVETFLEDSWVSRSLTVDGGLLADVHNSVIEGNVAISGTELGSIFCLSEVDGDASFTGNAGQIQIGGTSPITDCDFNAFGGDVTLTDNSAASSVTGNVIRGDLTCADNSPAPVVSDNRVRGEEDCEAASAAGFSTKSSTAFARGAEAKKTEILDAIADRTAEGQEAAEEAGPAFE